MSPKIVVMLAACACLLMLGVAGWLVHPSLGLSVPALLVWRELSRFESSEVDK